MLANVFSHTFQSMISKTLYSKEKEWRMLCEKKLSAVDNKHYVKVLEHLIRRECQAFINSGLLRLCHHSSYMYLP